jgi:hypothetical protein
MLERHLKLDDIQRVADLTVVVLLQLWFPSNLLVQCCDA